MDDIAFFDSSSYIHRGGIWPDAGRREKPNVSDVSTMPSAVDDDVSTVSAPPDVDSSSLTSGDLDPSYHHHSAALLPSRGPSPTPDPLHHDILHPRKPDPPVEDPDLQIDAAVPEVQHPGLRHKGSGSSEKSKKRFLGIRRTSHSPSLGSHSSSREPSPAPSLENLRTPSPEPLNGTGAHPDARPAKSPTPSGQSSLLSTLKSRAGDRQALSNTARETMRKWTVNWGGLKKDRDSGMASFEDAQDGRDSKPRSASQKVKSSYAEVRAAVDERRERERRSSEASSASIPIPGCGDEERADSVSSMQGPRRSSLSSLQTDISTMLSSAEQSAGTSPEASTTGHPIIDIEGVQPDSQDLNGIEPASIATPFPPTLPQRPIQSQPSHGKTMTIPGIHARNRGEVMSMGYVPPPPAPEGKSPVSSVYRLWKHSPATQSEHADGGIERTISHSFPVLSADSVETSPEPSSPTNTVRPEAPPLPPRMLHAVPSDSSSVSPASVALKSIVSRDDGCRAKGGEEIEASDASNPPAPVSPKPPLPPRKIQASA
jgi:hypothetical protein